MEEHQEKFGIFFREFTGRTLKRRALTGAAGAVKREAGPMSGKDQPKVKVRKTKQLLIEVWVGQVWAGANSYPLTCLPVGSPWTLGRT